MEVERDRWGTANTVHLLPITNFSHNKYSTSITGKSDNMTNSTVPLAVQRRYYGVASESICLSLLCSFGRCCKSQGRIQEHKERCSTRSLFHSTFRRTRSGLQQHNVDNIANLSKEIWSPVLLRLNEFWF